MNKLFETIESLSKLPIPSWIENNVLLALGRGLGSLTHAAIDVPTAWLESLSEDIRAKSEGKHLLQIEGSKAASELFKSDPNLPKKAFRFYGEKILRQQINREEITDFFVEEIKSTEFPKSQNDAIDEEWLNTFWNIAENKSHSDIKRILAKILAKEVSNPESISPLTLQTLSILTPRLGKVFQKICNVSFFGYLNERSASFVLDPKSISDYTTFADFDISLDELWDLENAGLIRSSIETLKFADGQSRKESNESWEFAGQQINYKFKSNTEILILTNSGTELRSLLSLKPNQKFLIFLKEKD